MVKDWRIPVCTRYRPLIVIVLVLGIWALSIFIGSAVQRNQREAWDAKLARIHVGTSRARLVEILGKPLRTERIGSDQGLWPGDATSEVSEWCARPIRKSRVVPGSGRVPEK